METQEQYTITDYEAGVTRAAKDLAEQHICDVLAAIESNLRLLRFNLRPEHDGKVQSADATMHGYDLATAVLMQMESNDRIRCGSLVMQCDEKSQLNGRTLHSAVAVRKHVNELLERLVKSRA